MSDQQPVSQHEEIPVTPRMPFIPTRSIVRPVIIPFTQPNQQNKEYQFHVLRFDPRELLKITTPGDHTLLVGQTGSGKTTTWMTLLFLIKSVARKRQHNGGKGEMIIVNDTKFETLLLSRYFKLRCFVPKGAFIDWDSVKEDPDVDFNNIETNYIFDPNNIERTLLPKLSKGRINVIFYEHLYHEPEKRCQFWGGDRVKGKLGFFASLLDFKSRGMIDCYVRIFYDEFEQICAGQKGGTFLGQTKLSNWIYQNLGAFRSAGIGFVASCWGINFLHKGITNQMQYFIFKRVRTPEALGPWEKLFNGCKEMPDDLCCFVTKTGKYDTKMGVDQIVDPKEFFIQHYLTLEADSEKNCKHKEILAKILQWLLASRTELVRVNVPGVGFKQKELAKVLGVADSTVTEIVKDIFPKGEKDESMSGIADKILEAQQSLSDSNVNVEGTEEEEEDEDNEDEEDDNNPIDRAISSDDVDKLDAELGEGSAGK